MRYLIGILILYFCFSSCRKQEFTSAGGDKLSFSVDTLRFDTVFTELGSATRILKVFNGADKYISISNIRLEADGASFFRLNVDGIPGQQFTDIEIPPEDSIYIFAEVTIDPNVPLSVSPFIINDAVLFETNGNDQRVVLEAWGQNANYIPNRFNQGELALLTCDLGEIVWDDPKPYVIYGVLFVDSCTLTLPPGTEIYVHGGFGVQDSTVYNDGIIFVLEQGRLNAKGSIDQPVVIQGDRLESSFEEVWGQWAGIILGAGSKNNVLEYTTVKNSIVGLRVDSAAELSMKHSVIHNTSGSGLLALHSSVDAENCLFYNNGGNNVQLEYGGDYDFTYCTLASIGVDNSALRMTNAFCLDQICENFLGNELDANFTNCIIYGSLRDEISFLVRDASFLPGDFGFDYSFTNCIVRVDDLVTQDFFPEFFNNCDNCINANSSDAIFANPSEDNYRLDTLSIAEKIAIPIPGISLDLEHNPRDPTNPDLGCYEYTVQ